MRVLKSSSTSNTLYMGDPLNYSVGIEGVKDPNSNWTDFAMVDLLPDGLLIESIQYSRLFEESNGKHEIIKNFQGTGRTAIVFTADELLVSSTEKNYSFSTNIATIKTTCDYTFKYSYFNEVYATVDSSDPLSTLTIQRQKAPPFTLGSDDSKQLNLMV